MKNKIILISNMYPSVSNPRYGSFVKSIHDCLKDQRGFDLKLISITYKKSKFIKLFSYAYFYYSIYLNLLFNPKALFYFHFVSHSTLPILFLKKGRRRYIFNFHGSDLYQVGILNFILTESMKKANVIISPSEYFADEIKNKFANLNCIRVIPTAGIPKQYFDKKGRNNLLTSTQKINLGFIGRVSEKKGIDIVFKVYEELQKKYCECKLIIAGNKLAENELTNYNSSIDFKKIVWIDNLGREDLHVIYDEIDILLVPSRYKESLGLVVLEGMSKNCIVLMSQQKSFKKILHGTEAVSSLENSSNRFVEEINMLKSLSKEKLSEKLNSSRITAQQYSEKNICKKYLKIFDEESFIHS